MAETGSATKGEDRRAFILERAMDLVMHYGYSRVSMDDIAKACGMSRPALYQFFRNKADIYQGIAADTMDKSLLRVAEELVGTGPLSQRLQTAIAHGVLDMVETLEATPHGAELLQMKSELDEPLRHFLESKVALLERAYREAGFADAQARAWQLADYVEGMKQRITEPGERRKALAGFLEIQAART